MSKSLGFITQGLELKNNIWNVSQIYKWPVFSVVRYAYWGLLHYNQHNSSKGSVDGDWCMW